jgi:hypothetical protein
MTAQPGPNKHDDLMALTDRAQRGDATALPALREFFEQPEMVEQVGNLAKLAQDNLIARFTGTNLLVKEGVNRKMQVMRSELSGPTPTPLDRVLVERIVTCWLHLHHLEMTYAGKENMSLELGAYYQRSLSSAQKRYLAAIKTLALVRKLAVPVLQVNIARKQVNVAGSCVTAESERATS